MFRTLTISAALVAVLASSIPPLAQQDQFGTATEAKVMLEKAVFAVKADKAKALAMFNKGEGGFKDRDLHPFCFNIGNGIVTAGPSAVLGKDVRTLKDPTGKAIGEDLYNAPREGTNEVSYMFPRPGTSRRARRLRARSSIGPRLGRGACREILQRQPAGCSFPALQQSLPSATH